MGGTDSAAAARERLRRLETRSDHYVSVALAGAEGVELVGYAWVQDYGPHLRGGAHTARLHDLYVAPEWRRRGVGRQLFEHVRAWAARRPIRWLQWQASTAAVPFYARLGLIGDTKSDLETHPFYELDFARVPAAKQPGQKAGSGRRAESSEGDVVIRSCHERDLAAVAGLYRQWEAEGITWGLVVATETDLRAKLGPFFLVAEQRKRAELLGFAIGRVCRATATPPDNLAVFPGGGEYLEVEDLYVAGHARRGGIGTRLMRELLEEARRRRIDHSTVFRGPKTPPRSRASTRGSATARGACSCSGRTCCGYGQSAPIPAITRRTEGEPTWPEKASGGGWQRR
jgi:GNAT superfamily N-acetyltransferase